MTTQPTYIVMQCYGDEGIFNECAYALLSLSRLYKNGFPANWEIWIYTDKPEWFSSFRECWLPLHFRKTDAPIIEQWRGDIDFVHRVKIKMLHDFVKERTGNIIYVDTDVVFTYPIEKIVNDVAGAGLYMHVMEGRINTEANPILKKLSVFLKQAQPIIVNGRTVNISPGICMWNAGVLAFNTSHKYILDEALAFTDAVYPRFPKHIVEQFAFSLYCQLAGNVKTAAPYILHYWNLKEARIIIASFFKHFGGNSWNELVRYSNLMQIYVLMQEKSNFFQNRSVADKLRKLQWQPRLPDWNLLMEQL